MYGFVAPDDNTKKEKIFRFFFIMFILTAICFVAVMIADHSEAFEQGGITYRVTSDTEVSVTYGTYSGDISIPSTVTYNSAPYSVTSIDGFVFYNNTSITSVSIPGSIETIGSFSFMSCTYLESVTINHGVKYINNTAFLLCTALTSVSLPDSVLTIDSMAFNKCSSLKSVSLGNGVVSIGSNCFSECRALESVNIPKSTVSIGDCAFYSCNSILSFSVSDDNPNYSSKDGVLFNKDKTVLIQYPAARTGAYSVPESVNTVLSTAFTFTSVSSIYIPDSLTTWGNAPLCGCTSLTSIEVSDENPNYSSKDGVLFNKDGTVLLQFPNGRSGSYAIPDTVTVLEEYCFSRSINIISVTIPDSISILNKSQFSYCSSLQTVTIPDSVPDIGYSVFYGCTSLVSLTIPKNVGSIGVLTFYGCTSLLSIDLPDSVTSVGRAAFQYCNSLQSVNFGIGISSIADDAFTECTAMRTVTIHNNAVAISNKAFKLGISDSPVTCEVLGCSEGKLDGAKNEYTTFVYKGGFTVTYLLDGTIHGNVVTEYFGNEVTVRDPAVKEGHTVTGWSSDSVIISDGKFIMPGKDVVLSATSELIKYTVSYDVNGGSGSVSSDKAVGPYILKKCDSTREGFRFSGWSDGVNTYPEGSEVLITRDITFKATWEEVPAEGSGADPSNIGLIIAGAIFILVDIAILALVIRRFR